MNIPDWMEKIKAIGFDLDGTLYPSNQKLNEEIERLKIEVVARHNSWRFGEAREKFDEVHNKLGSSTKTLIYLGVDGVEFFTRVWDEIELEKFIKRDERLVEMFERLKQARFRRRMFLLSNSNRRDQIKKKLALVGLDEGVFELVVSTVELGSVKPDPAPFLFCLEKLGLGAEEVLYVGDKVSTDIEGAMGVGMKTCLVWGESTKADISLPTVYDVGELLSY